MKNSVRAKIRLNEILIKRLSFKTQIAKKNSQKLVQFNTTADTKHKKLLA